MSAARDSGAPVGTDREALLGWLREHVAARLELPVDRVDVRARFKSYGLDSLRATAISAELSRVVGRALPQTLLWECPTIEKVVERVLRGDEAPAPSAAPRAAPAVADASEPIAIVGMACRFPSALTPEQFWENLRAGLDAIREPPADRWDVEAYFDEDPTVPGKSVTRWGAFLDDVATFDPAFFGISLREARDMAPQQRIVLELAWESLERSGIEPLSLRGSNTGVYVGVIANDYAVLQNRAGPGTITGHTATGAAYSIVANRISYQLGLEGPSMAIDTACSASLVAVHQACAALQRGEAELALAGGVHLLLAPESTVAMSKFGAMAPDGRSKAFDARANGYVRGEGAGLIVLEPLSRALANGRRPLALIRGSAVNNDGFSNGLTAPSPQAQEAVLRTAYRRAGVEPATVDFIEAHGTGTRLGDPIEATSLGNVLGRVEGREAPLLLGSVKTNIGHLEGAAGIAGLVKTTLALRHREIPANLHFQTPNPLISWEALKLDVPRASRPWPEGDHPPRAGVSSFGFGGTNCHVVLEAASPPEAHVLFLRASTEVELRQRAHAVLASLRRGERPRPPLGEGSARLAAVHDGWEELRAQLEAFTRGESAPGLVTGTATGRPRLVFVCGGQGSQWPTMGRALAFAEPAFHAALARCDEALGRHGGFSLFDELTRDERRSRLDQLGIIQPSIFAMQVGHAALFASWGIEPDAVIGHSMGEIAAAQVAGILELNDAARIACERSRLVQQHASGKGRMAAVDAEAGSLEPLVAAEPGVAIAAFNGPAQTIVAGDIDAMDRFLARARAQGIGTHVVRVDYASHSPHMDALRAPLMEALREVQPREARRRMLSTATLQWLRGPEVDATYWARNLREPVRFAQAVEQLAEGETVFVELSPHPLLAAPIEAQVRARVGSTVVLASARRGEAGRRTALETVAELFARGVPVDPARLRGAINDADAPGPHDFVVSFHAEAAVGPGLRALAERARDPHVRLEDLCAATAALRGQFDRKVAFRFHTREELVRELTRRASLPVFEATGGSAPVASSPSGDAPRADVLPPIPWERVRCWFDDDGRADAVWSAVREAALHTREGGELILAVMRALDGALEEGTRLRVVYLGADELEARALADTLPPERLEVLVTVGTGVEARKLERALGTRASVLVHAGGEPPPAHAGSLDVAIVPRGDLAASAAWLASGGVVLALAGGGDVPAGLRDMQQVGERGLLARTGEGAARAAFRTSAPRSASRAVVPEKAGELRRLDAAIPTWEVLLDSKMAPWLAEHVVAGAPVVPMATWVALSRMVLDAAGGPKTLTALELDGATVLEGPTAVQVALLDSGVGGAQVRLAVRPAGSSAWSRRAEATARAEEPRPPPSRAAPVHARELNLEEAYGALAARGLSYGPSFRGVERVLVAGDEAWATLADPGASRAEDTLARQSCRLDAAFQVALLATVARDGELWMPVTARRLSLGSLPARFQAQVVVTRGETLSATLTLRDEAGAVIGRIEDFVFAKKARVRAEQAPLADARYRVSWRPWPLGTARSGRIEAVLAGGDAELAERVALALRARGATCRHLGAGEAPPVDATDVVYLGALALGEDGPGLPGTARACAELAALAARAPGGRLTLITRGAVGVEAEDVPVLAQAALHGACATIALEHPELTATTLDLDPHVELDPATLVDALLCAPARERVALRRGTARVARLSRAPVPVPLPRGMGLGVRERGDLETLGWEPRADRPVGPREVRIETVAAGLNFRDVMSALGNYPGEPGPMGLECAGVVREVGAEVAGLSPGDRVVALWPGAFAAETVVPADVVARLPASLDFARAASVPAVFVTVAIALRELAQVRPGERVLVHAAAGGVGLAAIQVARAAGAEVLATAGSERKKRWLRANGVRVVADSRRPFQAEVLEATGGRGVDVVVGSFGGVLAESAVACLARGGRLVELAKNGVLSAEAVRRARPDVGYHVLALDALWSAEPARVGNVLRGLVEELAAGRLRPLPVLRFGFEEAARAFACMASARHIGKIVLEAERRTADGDAPWRQGTTLLTGAFGGVGLAAAEWLCAAGAPSLVLVGRSAPGPDALRSIEAMRAAGTDVRTVVADVGDAGLMERVVSDAPRPLIGVVHSAGVLDDGLVETQDEARFARTLAPKVAGAWNLHQATRDVDLAYFVAFGSIAAVLGSPGQCNHAAASFALAELMRLRRAEGRAGSVIDWGPWAEIGAAARARSQAEWTQRGVPRLRSAEGLGAFGEVLRQGEPRVMLARVDWTAFARDNTVSGALPLVSELVPRAREDEAAAGSAGPVKLSREELVERIRAMVARLLARSGPGEVDIHRPLMEMGLDSLLAVELRNGMSRLVGKRLSPTLTFNFPTVEKLAEHLAGTTAVAPVSTPVVRSPRGAGHEDAIAIVGLACRYPGAESATRFWDLLARGENAVRQVPAGRWKVEQYYEPGLAMPGKMNTRWGAFVEGIDRFDHRFFGVSQREAAGMDPQQRLLLEVVWHALEDAAIAPDALAGTSTGTFVGLCSTDFAGSLNEPPARAGTGVLGSITANRISYFLDLRGPSLVIDTACSSSLVALDLACQAIRAGKCSLAIAAGANVLLDPKWTIAYSQAGMMSPEGQCKTFDRSADGFVRGEGCGAVILKRLEDAERDGDPIIAVVRSTAVRHDGRSSALTAPSGHAQQALIEEALATAGVPPSRVAYVEAHGTGTPLGDPIELEALGRALAPGREPGSRCLVGSVKTNVGHLEGAAGLAGLIKVALAFENELVPRHLNLTELNPHIDLDAAPLAIASEAVRWPRVEGTPRIAGVSSFGLGGTIAHAVLEEAPVTPPPSAPQRGVHLLPLSARTPAALAALARSWATVLEEGRVSLADVCATAALGRAHLAVRLAVVGASAREVADALRREAEALQGAPARRAPAGGVSWALSLQAADAEAARGVGERLTAWGVPLAKDGGGALTLGVGAGTLSAGALEAPLGEPWRVLLEVAGRAYVAGVRLAWSSVVEGSGGRRVRLPGYPFERVRCWPEPGEIRASAEEPR